MSNHQTCPGCKRAVRPNKLVGYTGNVDRLIGKQVCQPCERRRKKCAQCGNEYDVQLVSEKVYGEERFRKCRQCLGASKKSLKKRADSHEN